METNAVITLPPGALIDRRTRDVRVVEDIRERRRQIAKANEASLLRSLNAHPAGVDPAAGDYYRRCNEAARDFAVQLKRLHIDGEDAESLILREVAESFIEVLDGVQR